MTRGGVRNKGGKPRDVYQVKVTCLCGHKRTVHEPECFFCACVSFTAWVTDIEQGKQGDYSGPKAADHPEQRPWRHTE